jgi:transposase, IS5 family
VLGQAKRFSQEISEGVKRSEDILTQVALEGLRKELDQMAPRLRQVITQTKARIFDGNTRPEGKLLSVFEPSTEIIRKGKAGKPNEFGKMVKLQEAENQIVIDFEVYDQRPNDATLLIPAIEIHEAKLGRTPHLVAADAAFYSGKNEVAFLIAPPKALSVGANRRSAGSARGKNGAQDARDASASLSADTALTAADTKARPE